MEIEAILFDLDGVLIDSTACVTRVWTGWALEHGYDPDDVVHVAHGRPAIETIQHFAPNLDASEELREVERRELADTDSLVVIEGAAALLSSLPADRWAVVTSATRALAVTRLQVAGLPVPASMITADDIVNGKPHPEPYLKGAALLGVTPNRCLVVEDAPSGIRAAKASEMFVIAVPTTYSCQELLQADARIERLSQIEVKSGSDGALSVYW